MDALLSGGGNGGNIMNYITQWFCKSCHTVKPRAAFPAHFDANTPCLECQKSRDTAPGSTTSAAPAQAFVRVRGNRMHGKDNRATD